MFWRLLARERSRAAPHVTGCADADKNITPAHRIRRLRPSCGCMRLRPSLGPLVRCPRTTRSESRPAPRRSPPSDAPRLLRSPGRRRARGPLRVLAIRVRPPAGTHRCGMRTRGPDMNRRTSGAAACGCGCRAWAPSAPASGPWIRSGSMQPESDVLTPAVAGAAGL